MKHEGGYIESLENSKTTYDVEQEDGWIDQMDKVYDDRLRQKLAYFKSIKEDLRGSKGNRTATRTDL